MMTLKEKLIVAASAITMVLCVLFGVGWVANGVGYGNFDLPILIKGIEVVKGVLTFFNGM